MSYALPAMPVLQLLIGAWILLPQFKGEFYFYHALLSYIESAEVKILEGRCLTSSLIVDFFNSLSSGSLKFAISYISEEVLVNAKETANHMIESIDTEITLRCERSLSNNKILLNRRDTYIMKNESRHTKGDMNKT
jgi:hypothetical protein